MKLYYFIFCLFGICLFQGLEGKSSKNQTDMIISTTQIKLKEFPCIWNPSLIKTKEGFLLTFRYCLAPERPWISYIGCVMLNDELKPISKAQLLNTREPGDLTSSQAEDARVFASNGKAYLIYNDNVEVECPRAEHRRDMFMAKIQFEKGQFRLTKPIKLFHPDKYQQRRIQKNWVPFDWKGNILLSYSLNPHEVIYPNLVNGECASISEVPFKNSWRWGEWRGGTPALLVDGEYLAFFHSSIFKSSSVSQGIAMHHYYMGAYTFSAEPPFEITSASTKPIIGDGFYTVSSSEKRVIFPGGFAAVGSTLYVAYGKDDNELWIAKIDKNKLKQSLQPTTGL
jgi:predicted GH43/DUF377 family glycosyl hydrolase